MIQNMAVSLLRHEIIRTTLPKAKELRRAAEPLITLARTDSVAKRRLAFDRLRDREDCDQAVQRTGTPVPGTPRWISADPEVRISCWRQGADGDRGVG
jgi:hypothetical protein